MKITLREGINWVGYVDWTVRDFHGYRTERGSSYNAYLVQDNKNALIDAVKGPFGSDLLTHVSKRVHPDDIDYVVCNHAEPDHAGALPEVMAACRNAQLVCNQRCRETLSRYHDTSSWQFKVVEDGESLSLGRRTFTFVNTPMVHWPESMMTYVPEEKLLFSMDAFGQHYAAAHLFDDEEPLATIMNEARSYYANIVMPYGRKVQRTFDRVSGLDLEIVAPSHGVVWRTHLAEILEAYGDWAACRPKPKVLVVFDSMWGSTAKMAHAILEGASELEIAAELYQVRRTSLTVLATEMLEAAGLACGSPTLNTTMMPEMAAFLAYMRGLKPRNKTGFSFGSYGWAKRGAKEVQDSLKTMQFEILRDPLQVQFSPTEETLEECREAGRQLARRALELVTEHTSS